MSLDPNVLHRANRRLAQRKAQREAQQAKRRAEIYRRCPRAAQIDRELRQTAAGIVSAAFRIFRRFPGSFNGQTGSARLNLNASYPAAIAI